MNIYFDQWFGLAAFGASLGDAEAVDFDQPDGNRLTFGQLVEQPVDADFCADDIFVAALAMLILQFVGGVAIGLAQQVDPAMARDGGKPRQERAGRVITRAFAVELDQRILHQIIDRIGRDFLREEPSQPSAGLFEQHCISLLVAALRANHQVAERFLARDHGRCWIGGSGVGEKVMRASCSLQYDIQLHQAQ